MAPIRVGVDLGQSHIRVGAFVLSEYMVAEGTEDIKMNGPEAPITMEIFQDVNDVVTSYFFAPNIQGAVVVVPNSTSDDNKEAFAAAAAAANFNIIEVINENTAVAAAYAYKVKPTHVKHLAIVSVTADVLDVSIYSIFSDSVFILETKESHPVELIEFDEHDAQESSHSRPGGLIGGVVGGAVQTLVVDPLDKAFDIVKKLLSNPKLTESPVDEVVFVGEASKSEMLKQAVKKRFRNARVWSPEDIEAEELAMYGASVIAFKQLTPEKNIVRTMM